MKCVHHGTAACLIVLLAAVESPSAQVPGRCNEPVSQRTSEVGCYVSAMQALASIAPGPVYWHLYNYPTRAVAEADKGANATVVEAFGKIWLYTIAEQNWRPPGGERVAVIGPFEISAGKQYAARYLEAVFTPGMQAAVHTHPGPEAFYLVTGTQCLETPDGVTITRAGESAIVPEGPPMTVSGIGTEMRRSVVLVLHDPSKPWIKMAHDWKPKGSCPE